MFCEARSRARVLPMPSPSSVTRAAFAPDRSCTGAGAPAAAPRVAGCSPAVLKQASKPPAPG
eukprot:5687276-Lingulodinium_polyedra.AAC.1